MGEIKQPLHIKQNSPSQSTRAETHPSARGLTSLTKQSLHLRSASPVPQGKPIKHLPKQAGELKFITPLGSEKKHGLNRDIGFMAHYNVTSR